MLTKIFNFFFVVILGKSHYLLYTLVVAMYPRWLVTLDEDLEPLPVSVRVGQVIFYFNFLGVIITIRKLGNK